MLRRLAACCGCSLSSCAIAWFRACHATSQESASRSLTQGSMQVGEAGLPPAASAPKALRLGQTSKGHACCALVAP